METRLLLIGILLSLFLGAVSASDYVIDGDTVYMNESSFYLSASPHTIHSSQIVYVNFTPKNMSEDMDIAIGVDSALFKPSAGYIYAPYNRTFYNNYTCSCDNCSIRYNLTPFKFFLCDQNTLLSNGSVQSSQVFSHWFEDINTSTNTVSWHEYERFDWVKITNYGVLNYNYGGMNKWYFMRNLSVVNGSNYRFAVDLSVPVSFSGGGKYWVCMKPTSINVSDAVASGRLYCVDPWWDATWSYKKNVNFTANDAALLVNMQQNITIDTQTLINAGKLQADCDDLRFINSTSGVMDYWIESGCGSTTTKVWVEVSRIPGSGIQQAVMYYGNSGAAAYSNGTNTFIFFDDWKAISAAVWNSFGTTLKANNSVLTINGSAGIVGKTGIGLNTIIETSSRATKKASFPDDADGRMVGWRSDTTADTSNPRDWWQADSASTGYRDYYGIGGLLRYQAADTTNGVWNVWGLDRKGTVAIQCDKNYVFYYNETNAAYKDTGTGYPVFITWDSLSKLQGQWIRVRKFANRTPSVKFGSEVVGTFANGAICNVNSNCTSHFCIDLRCCNINCSTALKTCARCGGASATWGGVNGTCSNITNLQDPDSECPGAFGTCANTTCSNLGRCNYKTAADGGCASCTSCSGSSFSCKQMANNTEDNDGANTCTGTCTACQSGSCGVMNAGTDPDADCAAAGDCNSGTCKGTTAVCGWNTTGDGVCPACQTCVGATSVSCKQRTNNTNDTLGPNTCITTCKKCSSGSCANQGAEDLFGQCPTTCSGYQILNGLCATGVGSCDSTQAACGSFLNCSTSTACRTTCTSESNCQSSAYYCNGAGSACLADPSTSCGKVGTNVYAGTANQSCTGGYARKDWTNLYYCTTSSIKCVTNSTGTCQQRVDGYIACDSDSSRSCGKEGQWNNKVYCTNQTCAGAPNPDSYVANEICVESTGCYSGFGFSVECPTCQTCSGTSCVNKADHVNDTIGSNLCVSICKECMTGACSNQGVGFDYFAQCGVVGCDRSASVPYYFGWNASHSCTFRTNVSAASASCNGTGSCYSAAYYCPSQPSDGLNVTCSCPEAESGCSGTTMGTCPGSCHYTINYTTPATGCSNGHGCKTPACSACIYPYFNATRYQQYNVTPFGQTGSLPFWNITNNCTSDVNVTVMLNQTSYAGVKFKMSTTKAGNYERVCTGTSSPISNCMYVRDTATHVLWVNLQPGAHLQGWLTTDFVGVPGGTAVNRNISISAVPYSS